MITTPISSITKKAQSGMSLISLMVSIALSSVTMLAATHMHTSHQLAVNELNDSIKHNRKLLTSLKVIEKEIQSAGYGISDAGTDHILIQFDAGDSSATPPTLATRSLLWRFVADMDNDGTVEPECRALIESGTYINGTEHRILTLKRSDSCHNFDPIENTNWNGTIGRLGKWEVKDELETHLNVSDTLFSFQLQNVDCSFPGLNNPESHLSVTITAPNSAELNGHTPRTNGITVCLTNMSP